MMTTTDQAVREELFFKLSNDDLLLYVLNEHNQYITKEAVEKILSRYGIRYNVTNLELFKMATVHTSYLKRDLKSDKTLRLLLTKDKSHNLLVKQAPTLNKDVEKIPKDKIKKTIELQTHPYERIEFLGDSVIRLVFTDYLYSRYDDQDEGFMTRLRTKLENGEALARLTKSIELNKYAIIARYFETQNGRTENHHILEDIFEAFIGALYLDGSFEICKKFLINLIEQEADIVQYLHIETNHKDTLLQFHHKMKWSDPEYGMIEQFGTEKKMFKMFVRGPDGEYAGIGSAPSKRNGEQNAARQALIKYGIIQEEPEDSDDDYEYEEEYVENDNKKNSKTNNNTSKQNSDDSDDIEIIYEDSEDD
jgi:dsRNA-specific ribonuclease